MNRPPMLLALALALWGWRCEQLALAIPMGVVLEATRWVTWRWHVSDRDFNRLADFTILGFVILAVYAFDAHGVRGIYFLLRWLPVVLVLLVVAQQYSTRERIKYTALLLTVRWAVGRGSVPDPGRVDFTRPYLVVCLVAASAGPAHREWFLPLAGALLAYLLWANRSRRYSPVAWSLVLALAVGLGYLGMRGVVVARHVLEPLVMDYLQERWRPYRDPYRAHTAMGHIGRLKLSDRIVLRVRPAAGAAPPRLLREATYQRLSRTLWLAGSGNREFTPLESDVEGSTWTLHEHDGPGRSVTLSAYLPRGKGMVVVPEGTFRLDDLPVEGVSVNPLGALKVLQGPELIEYRPRFDPAHSFGPAPQALDLVVPAELRDLIEEIASRLELRGREATDVVRRLETYFLEHFRYAVVLTRPVRRGTPLHDFLGRTRTGHCEFFASATVLLLRAAGIPARYATGYAVQEFSELENAYVVRRRHAHSWALAHVGGRWMDVDTTPPVWSELEAEHAAWWQNGYDLWSWVAYHYTRWRLGPADEARTSLLLWLLVPLVAVLAWRFGLRERVARAPGRGGGTPVTGPRHGGDSEFYDIERTLRRAGCERARGEPLARWLRRSARTGGVPGASELEDQILPLHYRYRFDPRGLTPGERGALRARVANWLRRHATRD